MIRTPSSARQRRHGHPAAVLRPPHHWTKGPMNPRRPPDFATIADANTKGAFVRGHPEVVQWLGPGTRLFKWTQSITTPKGITA
jgi:hypothetical protein